MIGCRFRGTGGRRRAFTLAEVLLTMCLLVILAALAWTAMEKPFAGLRLRKAADQIRAEWRGARVEAMDSGEIYIFRYSNENRFRIERYCPPATAGNAAYGDAIAQWSVQSGQTEPTGPLAEESLPKGVSFVSSETAPDTRAAMIAAQTEQMGVTEAVWSEPILFYPDGTTSTGRLVLKNEYDRCIELLLRGLTGVVNVGEVSASQESLR